MLHTKARAIVNELVGGTSADDGVDCWHIAALRSGKLKIMRHDRATLTGDSRVPRSRVRFRLARRLVRQTAPAAHPKHNQAHQGELGTTLRTRTLPKAIDASREPHHTSPERSLH